MNLKEQLVDIYELWHVPFWQTWWFFWVSFACIVILLLVTIFIIYHYFSCAKKISASQQALDQLAQLQAIATVKQGKKFFYSLSNIVKKYLYEELYKNANSETFKSIQGLTDEQILTLLPQIQQFSSEQVANLKQIFSGINLIKFANQEAVQKHIGDALKSAQRFIQQTSRQLQEAKKGQ